MELNRRDLLKTGLLASLAAMIPSATAAVRSIGETWLEYTPETWNEWSMFNVRFTRTHRQYGEITIDAFEWMMCAGRTKRDLFHVIGAVNRNGKTFLKLGCRQSEIEQQKPDLIGTLCQQAKRELTATGVIS